MSRFTQWKYYPWLVWGLGAAFFCAEYFARLAPSVMVRELMQAFKVDALGLGTLSAFFYISYLAMQLPVGMLVDRYGAHRLLRIAALVCGLSCILLGVADSLWMAELSRFLIGFGAAFAFVGTLKLATIWFPANRFGFLAGTTQAIGMLGAAIGEGPVALAVSNIGWRSTMYWMAVILIILSLLIWLFVHDHHSKNIKNDSRLTSLKDVFSGLSTVLRNPQTWWVSVFAALIYAPTGSFAELWGVTYLQHVHHFSHHIAAEAVSMIFLGWGVGGPLSGWISDRLGRRKPNLWCSAVASLVLLSIVLYCPELPTFVVFVALFLYGMANTGLVTAYALSGEINAQSVTGISMAFTNMSSVLLATFIQPFVGWLLNFQWDGRMLHGIKVYTSVAYQWSMLIMPCCLVLAFFSAFMIKETYCHRVEVLHKPE